MAHYASWEEEIASITRNELQHSVLTALIGTGLIPVNAIRAIETEPGMQPTEDRHIPAVKTLCHLNAKQAKAHGIITNHLLASIEGRDPQQLLMVVRGQGGVGKSMLIEAVMQTFEDMGSLPMLSKMSTSGMTASLIRGMTVHSWASILVASPSSEH
jgi:hypothetical protein